MKLGAENKKAVYFLLVLVVVAGYGIYSNLTPSVPVRHTAAPSPIDADAVADAPPAPEAATAKSAPGRTNGRLQVQEFHPALRPKKKEDQIADIRKVDPTIRMDWLKKVQEVPPAGSERDLFQILKAPPVHEAAVLKGEETHVWKVYGPQKPPPPPPPPPDPSTIPPPPIPLKYYGYCTEHNNGKKLAYFLDTNDEVIQATEGMTLKGRYRVVHIGLNTVVMEDTQNKRQQDLPIEKEAVTG